MVPSIDPVQPFRRSRVIIGSVARRDSFYLQNTIDSPTRRYPCACAMA